MCIAIDININQPQLFGMHEHGEGHVISHCSTCIDWFPCMCVGMMEHSFTINSVIQGYHVYKLLKWMGCTNRLTANEKLKTIAILVQWTIFEGATLI